MKKNEPLAYAVRPKTFDDMIGQEHLIGKNGVIRQMLMKNKLFSLILYGPPGVGKTTIAEIIATKNELHAYKFNASIDNKKSLTDIIKQGNMYGNCILIIDEIHRMKKDIQDYLLPFLENGSVTLIGLTTNNPYHSVNPAIRSRCHILRLNPFSDEEIKLYLQRIKNTLEVEKSLKIDDLVYDYISSMANGELRTAINMLELVFMVNHEHITLEDAKKLIMQPALSLDKNADNYYDTLSAFQKSIRGSDVDAAIHYLARLIAMEDLDSIIRRMLVIAYEDIGLGNPGIGPKVYAACQAAKQIGFPEARIPLSVAVCDMALSPKSNSAYNAINLALEELNEGKTYNIPKNIKSHPEGYLFPHDYDNSLVKQQYLPNELQNQVYYHAKTTGKYERALKERNTLVKKINNK